MPFHLRRGGKYAYFRAYPRKDAMKAFEVIEVDSLEVVCDGGGGATGHPRVFLHIDQDKGEITCPYCSRQYVLRVVAARKSGSH
jgi:uncharacterized Zn-finger protein